MMIFRMPIASEDFTIHTITIPIIVFRLTMDGALHFIPVTTDGIRGIGIPGITIHSTIRGAIHHITIIHGIIMAGIPITVHTTTTIGEVIRDIHIIKTEAIELKIVAGRADQTQRIVVVVWPVKVHRTTLLPVIRPATVVVEILPGAISLAMHKSRQVLRAAAPNQL